MKVNSRVLDVQQETEVGKAFRSELEKAVVSQKPAIDYFIALLERYKSRLVSSNKPIGSVLFTGPTGAGKTFATESFAELLQATVPHDWRKTMLRIDCGEFQHTHEIAKLIGSPPGYLGHNETEPLLSPRRIRELQAGAPAFPFAIRLFDEIEKASNALWHMMLAILDKGSITLGTNVNVDLTQTVIVLTSNAGFEQQGDKFGFEVPDKVLPPEEIAKIGAEAAKRKFTIEFINRLDAVIAFKSLSREEVSQIIDRELTKLQLEVFAKCEPKVPFRLTQAALKALLDEGYDKKYNARNAKRAIDVHLRVPLARIFGGKLVTEEEAVIVDYVQTEYVFRTCPIALISHNWESLL